MTRTIDTWNRLERKNCAGTMVSVEEGSRVANHLREGKPKAATVHILVPPRSISPDHRAKMIWATIDILKDVLGNDRDAAYNVVIDDRATNAEVATACAGDLGLVRERVVRPA